MIKIFESDPMFGSTASSARSILFVMSWHH
jgi:hypothetical protein